MPFKILKKALIEPLFQDSRSKRKTKNKKMIDLIKSIIWMAILIFAGYYLMGYFGYEINPEFFSYSKKQCQERISECTSSVVQKGLGSAEECQFDCVDPELIIKKK